jgi:hypothetical protein
MERYPAALVFHQRRLAFCDVASVACRACRAADFAEVDDTLGTAYHCVIVSHFTGQRKNKCQHKKALRKRPSA